MSDNPQDKHQEINPPSGGGFGKFSVDDTQIGVIRRPENAHLDENEDSQEKPAE